MKPRGAIITIVVALVLVIPGLRARDARAQAWMGDQNNLDLSLDYNFATSSKVVGDSNIEFPHAGTRTQQLTLAGEYVPLPRLAVNAELPFVLLKYTGDKTLYPHPGGGSYDDGSTHATLTDLRVGARYQVLEEPFALTPAVAVSIPVADYETIGNTVAGRHLKALHLGVAIGRVLGEASYVHLQYEFSLVESYDRTPNTAKYGQDRSDLVFTIGHKLLDQQLDIHLDGNARLTHDGINFSQFSTLPVDDVLYHDAILAEDVLLLGGGAAYQVNKTVAANLSLRVFVTGKNTQNASVAALGVTWSPL